jgi:hypothetical protein
MNKKLTIQNQIVEYEIKRNWRSRRIRLTLSPDLVLRISAPHLCSDGFIQNIIKQKADWILKKLDFLAKKKRIVLTKAQNYDKMKEICRQLVEQKIKEINKEYNFSFNRVAIRNQKTRWGSCSRNKNLNFSYKLIFLPERLADYIVAHELCHLQELNHSRRFWDLVQKNIPDYKERRKELRNIMVEIE